MLTRRQAQMHTRSGGRGQVLVLFGLFLLVLLGISALAVDYASWLLTDRALQNVSDHAALAGAAEFNDRTTSGNCTGGLGQQKCYDARAQAWASINNELNLGLTPTIISCLATTGDSPTAGETTSARASSGACTSEAAVPFGGRTIWVSTPPPNAARYTNYGGKYALNFGIVWVRVDQPVRSFLGGALGIQPMPRTGWATAGSLPTDFALETFCRIGIGPSGGACSSTSGLSIDGQGGIRLLRGDIGTNESLKVTATGGQGVQLVEGNMFLVNDVCGTSTWRCPNGPPSQGGLSNGSPSYTGKNAFYMAPLPVPQFASPITANTRINTYDCSNADATHLCVPPKDQGSATPSGPGDWTCSTSSSTPARCGIPTVTTVSGNSTVTCAGQGGGNAGNHYYPVGPSLGNGINPTPNQNNGNKYQNIDDVSGDSDTLATNPTKVDFLYTDNIAAGGSSAFIVNLGASGPRLSGPSIVRYNVFKTNNGTADASGNVTVTVRLLPGSGSTAIAADTAKTLTDIPTQYSFSVGAGVIPASQFNSLRLEFTFSSPTGSTPTRGGAVAWAEIEHPDPQPATPPMIPPGYYQSIVIPDGSCAVLDPTAEYSSLMRYQMPGIYLFGGSGSNSNKKIKLGTGAYLIGDGVTLVFDKDWPDSGSNQGVATSSNSALVLNTMRVPSVATPCTPTETEALTVNQSVPLSLLPYSSVCAAWTVDTSLTSGVRPGQASWPACDPANLGDPHCVNRAAYSPVLRYRGVTMYFTPAAWPPTRITNRFEMQGTDAGIAFRGVLYAPYDDVKISGGNGFSTVGQVLGWTAKFNGGGAFIDLDYPYDPTPVAPYLLEPTIAH
jgi:hypothetical protein